MFVPFHAYEASAGSGKTFSLVVRYLSLLFMGEDADRILALTFTNKAANEMQERIIETLKSLNERGELAVIAEVTGMGAEEILVRRKEVLSRFLNADTKVMTIDKFFAKILRKFSLHAGLMPNFTTFESQHELKVMARFLALVDVEGKEDTLINLALMASKRLSDIFTLLDELYSKSKELDYKAFSSVPYALHADAAMKELRELQAYVNGHPDASKTARSGVEADDIDTLTKKSWLERDTFDYRTFSKIYDPKMDISLRSIKAHIYDYMQAREQHFMHGLFSLLATYEEAKRRVAKEDGELSFDDITALVYYLLKERIDSEFLYFRLDSRISHMLLDEFQDTSIIQFEILRPLIEEMRSGEGAKEKSSLFLVGDVKQSIYRFRGGTKALFHAVTDAYELQVDQLSTNYRSHRHVVEFVNDVFIDKIERYEPQLVKEGAGEGYIEVLNDDDILEAMKHKVKSLLEQGVQADDIAVLTATNADGSAVEELLREESIEVVTETTSKLINQKVVRALIEYLKYSYFGETIYARNFFALIEIPTERLERCDIHTSDLAGEVKKVIERYALYDGDMNLLRFMELLSHYRDLEQFLFEYERIDAKAAQMDLNGVRVLTVHKSKGLEYDQVIVLDRLGRGAPNTDPIIYEYDGIYLQNIFLRMKNRDLLDPAYALALEKEKRLSDEDALNALYVAFTRARVSLFVIQKSKGSKFEMLGLEPQHRGVLEVQSTPEKVEEERRVLSYTALTYGTQSDVVHDAEEDDEYDHQAVTFGLALHYTLELMAGFTRDALSEALQATWNRFGAQLDELQLKSIERRIVRLLEDEQFTLLTQGKIHKEQPISYDGQLRYLDLLIEHDQGWTVIDYKSALSHSESHLIQVGFYKKALRAITQAPVKGYLCYLLEEGTKLVEV
ncbi:MAG: RecB-like helicase [Campylobacterota bacterium]|nr:RecB-like helicase [Campylobacterota bacterium]